MLERNLGVRLFQRSTRKLTLTEAGERFLPAIRDNLAELQAAIACVASDREAPAGTVKVSMSLTFGMDWILPMLPEFMARYPDIRFDWRFENRQVDLIAEGYDAAIGGGFELASGLVARTLAPVHLIAVAAPQYMRGRTPPQHPGELVQYEGIVRRSTVTGRAIQRTMRNLEGEEAIAVQPDKIVLNDPAAVCRAALLGLGVALMPVPDAYPHLKSGALVRLLPKWYADLGAISLYYSSRTLLPAKTRAFVDFITEVFRRDRLAERFAGSLG
jgi:DNA-binding transcriptional LysR family regulator